MSSQVRERVSKVEARRTRVTRLPFGLSSAELVVAVLALLFFLIVIVYYFTSLRPEQARLDRLQGELKKAQSEIAGVGASTSQGTSTAMSVRAALDSLQAFKSEHLRPLASGRIELINQINALAKKNSMTLTSGIDMPLEKAAESADQDSSKRKKTEDLFNIFPHMNMHFTVFGQYNNVRAFINELEHNKQFLVVKSINIASQEEKTGEGGGGRRGGRGGGISGLTLTVEAVAYFQP
jgi:Tfp pilus assembly protein PilO